jgi:FdhD protein
LNDLAKSTASFDVIRCAGGDPRSGLHELIGEEPLLIRVEGSPYSVVMRTPGEEVSHAAGFCLGEGIADGLDDFVSIGYCRDLDPNVIEVRLKPERRASIHDVLQRRGFVSQTSCGICGKEMLKDLYQIVAPIEKSLRVEAARICEGIHRLPENQKYYKRTRGSHAAMILDDQLGMVSFGEDVGRHNALDKAIGSALVNRKLSAAGVLILSSRISYELVQKAARARIPIVVGMSRPTALAAELGRCLNMTLACADRASGLILFSGANRIAP